MRGLMCGFVLMCGMLSGCGLPVPSTEAATKDYFFKLEGKSTTITFQLPTSPTPDGIANQCAFNENSFCEMKIPVTINGEEQLMVATFYGNGGMSLATGVTVPMVDLVGPNLFTGTLWTPTFTPGKYTLMTGSPRIARETYTLIVSATLPK